ncbi:YcxB family protein [Actinoplanes sp. CA-142083]|uniref:YcxB family protein n=1 Tax=Actinoplanes sp. CA-142083 TaxID=3239903 RepID=UPI003D8E1EEA
MALSSYGIRANIGRALPVPFLIFGIGQTLLGTNPLSSSLPMGLFLLVIPAFFELLALASWGLRRKAFAQPVKYEFTTTGMTQLTGAARTDVAWDDVTRVDRRPSTWIVRLGGGRSLRVPRKALALDDRRTLNDFFLAHPVAFG